MDGARRAWDRPVLARIGASILIGLVFWLDAMMPAGVAVPALYVLPTLLCVWARQVRETFIVAAICTLLTLAGMFVTVEGGSVAIARVNRPLEILTIWLAASLIAAYRQIKDRLAEDLGRSSRAMAESLRGLDEIRYALDQAAIVATTDQRGIITYANDKFCEISKYSRQELIGQDHRIVNSGYHGKEFIRDLWRTIAQGKVWRGEIRNRAKDGAIYWVDTTIVPFLDGRGKPRQYLAIRSDITQRKLAEAQIREQSALTQLGGLAAIVAHEVRNPLAGLRASLQVLDRRFPPEAREHEVIAAMIQRIDSLNEKLQDLLYYARPKAPRLQAVDVRAVALEAVASARAAVGDGCPDIDVRAEPVAVTADAEMLRAALLNLTLNACQASHHGPVELVTAISDGSCRITVMDRGTGIPAEARERVFEPFFTTRAAGTGLGLAIVKRLMDVQGGTIALSDRPGGGTLAELTLPLARR
jgi:two-component system CheB/CheR fusion protein